MLRGRESVLSIGMSKKEIALASALNTARKAAAKNPTAANIKAWRKAMAAYENA